MAAAVMAANSYSGAPFSQRRPAPLALNLSYSINRPGNGGPLISPARSAPVGLLSLGGPRTPRTPSFGQALAQQQGRRRGSNSQERPTTPLSATARRFSLPSMAEQDHFRSLCRSRFYDNDLEATRAIDALLKEASPSAQSCYNRILSDVRAQYHEDVARRKRKAFEEILRETDGHCYLSQEERKENLRVFLATHASKEMIGTHPFAKALYAMVNLQALKALKGGAGERCLEWTLDEEVFTEAGPVQWTRDSLALLKMTLAFEDITPIVEQDASGSGGLSPILGSHTSMLPEALDDAIDDPASPFIDQPEQSSTVPGHARRTSDPFSEAHAVGLPTKKRPPPVPMRLSTLGSSFNVSAQAGVLQEGRKRTFRMSGHLTNPNLQDLVSVFPNHIATAQVRSARFSTPTGNPAALSKDPGLLEEGALVDDQTEASTSLKVGTGHLSIGAEYRQPGWEGTLIERVKGWLKRVFTLSR